MKLRQGMRVETAKGPGVVHWVLDNGLIVVEVNHLLDVYLAAQLKRSKILPRKEKIRCR